MDPREATRRTVVVRREVIRCAPGDSLYPRNLLDEDDPSDIWMAFLTTRTGMMPTQTVCWLLRSADEAQSFERDFQVGREIDETGAKAPGKERIRREYIQNMIDGGGQLLGVAAGDEESGLAFEVLDKAGVTVGLGISRAVTVFLGKQRIGMLKSRYRDNWRVAAVFEYCWLNFPHSSLAYVAAAYQFHHYITHDDFSAGYLWRDLEILANEVETKAEKSTRVVQAAVAGGKARAATTQAARRTIISQMENMVSEGMSVTSAAQVLSRRGVGASAEANRKLWNRHKVGTAPGTVPD